MNVRHTTVGFTKSVRTSGPNRSIVGAWCKKSEYTSVRFQDLGLSGLSFACNSAATNARKVFWGILWLLASIWCFMGCTNCVIEYVSSPFTVNVKYQRNNSLTAPYVTLCPSEPKFRNPAISSFLLEERYGSKSDSEAIDILLKYNMSIEELWNISRFEITTIEHDLYEIVEWFKGFSSLSQSKVEMRELLTIHGTCLTFTMNSTLSCMGMQNGMNIKGFALRKDGNASSEYYTGVIHSAAEIPIVRYTGTFRTGFYTVYRQLTTAALRVQQVIHVNTWKNPCQSEDSFLNCMITCTEKMIMDNSKLPPCRLPYMEEMLALPLCTSANEFLSTYEATQISTKCATPENCSCIPPCSKVTYKEDYYMTHPVHHLFGIYVIIPSCDIEVIEEILMYGFTSFLSDIGGSLGLFLGMSILSIFEILEVVMMKAFSKLNR